jgi:hypothetical protein
MTRQRLREELQLEKTMPAVIERQIRFVAFVLAVSSPTGAGNARAYVQRRLQDFFERHLLGVEPPNRNADDRDHLKP